jgi:SAM-dependent methyltransferase
MFRDLSALSCSDCHADLAQRDRAVVCSSCGRVYRQAASGPLLFEQGNISHEELGRNDRVTAKVKIFFKRYRRFYAWLKRVFGTSCLGLSPQAFLRKYAAPDLLTVNLGSGTDVFSEMPVANVDAFPYETVDIVADLRRLPFKDGSVDRVISCSVLEHVAKPEEAFAEMYRVVKKGGFVYLTVPFIYPYHASPKDFTRWTFEGIANAMEPFRVVQMGVRHGPTSAMILTVISWLSLVLSFGVEALYAGWHILFTILFMPFGHLFDALLGRLPMSQMIASGFYIVGQK